MQCRLLSHVIVGVLFLNAVSAAHADIPLKVEEILTDQGRYRLELTGTYSNSDQMGLFVGEPLLIQTGPTSFVVIPTQIGQIQNNTDTLVGSLGLRYGVTSKTEITSRVSYLFTEGRQVSGMGFSSQSDSYLADAWVGISHQFKGDDQTPAILGFGELALYENRGLDSSNLKSTLIGLTAYKAIDPVVFAITAAYRASASRNEGGANIKPGAIWTISPTVVFAANDRVSLSTGFQWTAKQADSINGQALFARRTQTSLVLGVGYGLQKGSSINLSLKANTSGGQGADLRLSWLQTL